MSSFRRAKKRAAASGPISEGVVQAAGDPWRDRARAVVAASTRIVNQPNGYPLRITREAWTNEAWRQYDICGELHFATSWLSNSVGRCRLTLCEVDSQGNISPPINDTELLGIAQGLLMNPGLQNELLSELTKNLTIAGDCYLLGEANPYTGVFDIWQVLSIQEVQTGLEGTMIVNIGDSMPRTLYLDQILLIRVHRPHPRQWFQADSPTRAALPVLRELEELSKYLFATINSRLAGAGILGVPSEMNLPTPQGELQPGETPFMAVLAEGMITPIEDMSSPSALVPIVIEAPAAALASMTWLMNPNGHLTTDISNLRKAAIERLALSLDLSPDTLFGTGNASRWGQWTIEEQSIKFHIEPVMVLICSAFTNGFLTPSIEAKRTEQNNPNFAKLSNGRKYVFWYDASDLIQRPDNSTVALNLYDRGELSGAALRRESGFQEDDAPAGEELLVRQIMKFVALDPQAGNVVLPALAKAFGWKLGVSNAEILTGQPDELQPSPIGPQKPKVAPPSIATPGVPPGAAPQPVASPTPVPQPNTGEKDLPKAPKAPKTAPNKDGKTQPQRAGSQQ